MKEKLAKLTQSKPFMWLVVLILMVLPTLYAGIFLGAYWDPYSKIHDLPVAIVNEDQGQGDENKGQDLVESVEKANAVKLTVTDKTAAEEGLNDGTYYAVIDIPSDFTADLKSASTTDKHTATLTYSPNQKSNYLASQLINQVVTRVEKQVRSQVASQIVSTLSDQLNSVPGKVQQIDDGLITLANGSNTLRTSYIAFDSGVSRIASGATTLASGVTQLDSGIAKLQAGATTLNTGLSQLNTGLATAQSGAHQLATAAASGATQFQAGASKLAAGASELDTGIASYVELVSQIEGIAAKGQTEWLTSSVSTIADKYCNETMYGTAYGQTFQKICAAFETLTDEQKSKTITVAFGDQLKTGSATIKSGASDLSTNMAQLTQLSDKLSELASGLDSAKSGADQLTDGAAQLVAGTDELKSGSEQVLSGSSTLASGAQTLAGSSKQVASGITTLNNGINTAEDKVSESIDSTKSELTKLDGLSEFAANPVTTEENDVNKVDNYGTAFGPFFLSMALWVGSLMLFMVLYDDVDDRFKHFSRNADNGVSRSFWFLGAAAVQGIALGVILQLCLGFNITNYPLYLGSMILVAFAFEAIVEFLILWLGDAGKLIVLVLLILQLASAGGTFPVEVVDPFFQGFYHFMPMTYSIQLFRESVVALDSSTVVPHLLIILGIFVVFFALNLLTNFFRDRKNRKKVLKSN